MPERARCPHCGAWRPGRPRLDDEAAISHARALLAAGFARSVHDACTRAAALHARSAHNIAATRDRLRRKMRTEIKYFDRETRAVRAYSSIRSLQMRTPEHRSD
jgi:hypothetical protein